jgi:hypothetical protein
MTTAAPTTALVMIQYAFTDAERLAGYLAGYRGLTREAYALDLRQFTCWCRDRSLSLSAVRRADIEGFARELEARGRARATVTRRLCTIAGFYKYAVEEGRHHPAGAADRPGDRPVHRRTHRRASVPGRGRSAAGPARCRTDRPQGRAPCRDHLGRHPAHAQARVHHRRARRRGPAARCPRGCLAC